MTENWSITKAGERANKLDALGDVDHFVGNGGVGLSLEGRTALRVIKTL